MTSRRTLMFMLWLLGTLGQVFAFLFAHVPGSDSEFLGTVLLVACGLLMGAVVRGRTAWSLIRGHGRDVAQTDQLMTMNVVITIAALVQFAFCVYWLIDLLIYEARLNS